MVAITGGSLTSRLSRWPFGGTFDKAALDMVAYKDFIESKKLALGAALFEFALISEAAPLEVSLNDIALLNLPALS